MSYFTLFLEGDFFLCECSSCTDWIINGFVVLTQGKKKNIIPSLFVPHTKQHLVWMTALFPPNGLEGGHRFISPQTAVRTVQVPPSNPCVNAEFLHGLDFENTGPYPNHNFFIWFEDARSLRFTRKSCHLCKLCFNSLQINTTALERLCLWKQKTPESESNTKLLIHVGKSPLYF